jgi:ABC-type polysaccharide/polyol phosphate transport system ATPase subunit
LEVAIRFENVSKRFSLHQHRPRSLQELALTLFRRGGNDQRAPFRALDDVSFEILSGETIGFIGPNGAGKSTALKLIARILEPTSGEITVNGQVRALLELGAGFHPDLTGRDNIFLNGSILGLSRAEVRQKLDQIIAFAEIGQFIDVPVKHYSSGMHVRLGFSIAVHTDPEILLVDEVLAVGDATFQQKCLEKVKRMKAQGVTIVFVSHDLGAVRNLCQRGVWLDSGRLAAEGPIEKVVDSYLYKIAGGRGNALQQQALSDQGQRWGNGQVVILRVELLDANGEERVFFETGEPVTIRIHFEAHRRIERPVFGVAIHSSDGVQINGPNTRLSGYDIPHVEGRGAIEYSVKSLSLLPGTYELTVTAYDYECILPYDHHHRMYTFIVEPGGIQEHDGHVYLPSEWSLTMERPS